MSAQIGEAVGAHEQIDVIIFMANVEGVEPAAVSESVALAVQLRSGLHVRRYGVVGAPALARAVIELSDAISPVEAKTFDRSDETSALERIDADRELTQDWAANAAC